MILIHSEVPDRCVGLPPGIVRGIREGGRSYTAQGNFLALEASDAHLTSEDAVHILKMPGFRLATAEESEKFAADANKPGGNIREGSTFPDVPTAKTRSKEMSK